MSVVIIGGNERMERQYEEICTHYGCRAKVFTKESGSMKRKLGQPDLLIIFTNTVSHRMTICASQEAKRVGTKIERVHNSSAAALHTVLNAYCNVSAFQSKGTSSL